MSNHTSDLNNETASFPTTYLNTFDMKVLSIRFIHIIRNKRIQYISFFKKKVE